MVQRSFARQCCAKRSEAVNCHSCRPRHHGASDQDDKRPDGRFCHCHPPRNRHKRAAYCWQMCSRRVRRNSFRIGASTGVAPQISDRQRAQYGLAKFLCFSRPPYYENQNVMKASTATT